MIDSPKAPKCMACLKFGQNCKCGDDERHKHITACLHVIENTSPPDRAVFAARRHLSVTAFKQAANDVFRASEDAIRSSLSLSDLWRQAVKSASAWDMHEHDDFTQDYAACYVQFWMQRWWIVTRPDIIPIFESSSSARGFKRILPI